MRDDLSAYRASEREQQRIEDLLALLPASGRSVLDVGARDGYLSRLLAERFDHVVALDLEPPSIAHARIECVKGDATALAYADETFDAVVCSEVLEHVPPHALLVACSEIARVARDAVLIGVPYRQDVRCGRTLCRQCGRQNPPWGHVNTFDENRLRGLFAPLAVTAISYVGTTREITNVISTALMRAAGYPYGTYEQEEPCIHCGSRLEPPRAASIVGKIVTKLAVAIDRAQRRFTQSHANWIHMRFDKRRAASSLTP
jgi:SAM-dependent methyltransferase